MMRNNPFPDLSIDDFLYGHEGPWPQPSRDHPFGLAPGIYQIPDAEWADWKAKIGEYYLKNSVPFGLEAAAAAASMATSNPFDYPAMTDAEFTTLVSEGLFSKFLSPLDDYERRVFADYITDTDRYEYWKADYSCMRVVKQLYPGEAACASVTLLRRLKSDQAFTYEIVALILQVWDGQQFVDSEVFTNADGEAWRVARYFVLQGAIHRINLIDHTEVHFPPDAINAISKTVLPKDNLVLRLLQPHLWLSMCVNNTVLEGQRSLINRNTWYPWSPFVAKGDEVRKLLPFGWFGSDYYAAHGDATNPAKDVYFDAPNSSYPPYRYEGLPETIPSGYGQFLNSYFPLIRKFTAGVIERMSDKDWTEIGYWAHHIAIWIPGFPDREELLGADGTSYNKARLADVLAHFIWNASIRHSSDHQTLHEMVNGRRDANNAIVVKPMPVPFILRVQPPLKKDYKTTPMPVDTTGLNLPERVGDMLDRAYGDILHHIEAKPVPLCWPHDPISAHYADLLFYQPHNSLSLINVGVDASGDRNQNYAFDTPELKQLVADFHADLTALDSDLATNRPQLHFVPLAQVASSIQY